LGNLRGSHTGREAVAKAQELMPDIVISRHQHAGPERRGRGEKNPNGIEER